MKSSNLAALLLLISMLASHAITAQNTPQMQFKDGIGIVTPDSTFSVNFRFRMQNRMGFTLTDDDTTWNPSAIEFRTRRLRLRLDGFVLNKHWKYAIQLSFTRGDQDWDNAGVPNVVRDAMVFYEARKEFKIGFGQGKLPGNRQRVVSSGEQQFVDRSNVNATLNVDRDFGLQLYYHFNTGPIHYNLRGALTSGEGRNEGVSKSNVSANAGMCYTGRFEIMPFGIFTEHDKDYFKENEGDLKREPKPKLSLGGGVSFNNDAVRTGGQLGKSLYESRDINTMIFDGLFKWRGISAYGEYIRRLVPGGSPITSNDAGAEEFVYDGEGILAQSGYLFKNNFEIVGRFAQVMPLGDTRLHRSVVQDFTVGCNKYLRQHRVKVQFDATLQKQLEPGTMKFEGQNLQFRFQIELGI